MNDKFSLNNSAIREILKPWVLAGTDSQIGIIGTELVRSLYAFLEKNPKINIRNDTYEYEGYLSCIGDLINDLRDSRYNAMSEKQREDMNTAKLDYWEYADTSREAFLKKTENLSNKERHQLVRSYQNYDRIWEGGRPSIREFITSGKVVKTEYQTRLDYPCLRTDTLEEVARIYTINTWMQSPYLEWLLVDALLFNEASLFACMFEIDAKKPIYLIKRWLLEDIFPLFIEGFILALTAFVSDLIDEAHGNVYWIIFATITLVRWLNPFNTKKIALKEAEQYKLKLKQLATDMIKANDRSKDIDVFNARLVREMLYDQEKRGAVYSQAIFNVLDKRIARE